MKAAPDEKWQAYWDLHVMAAVRIARGPAPLMKGRGGAVILHNEVRVEEWEYWASLPQSVVPVIP